MSGIVHDIVSQSSRQDQPPPNDDQSQQPPQPQGTDGAAAGAEASAPQAAPAAVSKRKRQPRQELEINILDLFSKEKVQAINEVVGLNSDFAGISETACDVVASQTQRDIQSETLNMVAQATQEVKHLDPDAIAFGAGALIARKGHEVKSFKVSNHGGIFYVEKVPGVTKEFQFITPPYSPNGPNKIEPCDVVQDRDRQKQYACLIPVGVRAHSNDGFSTASFDKQSFYSYRSAIERGEHLNQEPLEIFQISFCIGVGNSSEPMLIKDKEYFPIYLISGEKTLCEGHIEAFVKSSNVTSHNSLMQIIATQCLEQARKQLVSIFELAHVLSNNVSLMPNITLIHELKSKAQEAGTHHEIPLQFAEEMLYVLVFMSKITTIIPIPPEMKTPAVTEMFRTEKGLSYTLTPIKFITKSGKKGSQEEFESHLIINISDLKSSKISYEKFKQLIGNARIPDRLGESIKINSEYRVMGTPYDYTPNDTNILQFCSAVKTSSYYGDSMKRAGEIINSRLAEGKSVDSVSRGLCMILDECHQIRHKLLMKTEICEVSVRFLSYDTEQINMFSHEDLKNFFNAHFQQESIDWKLNWYSFVQDANLYGLMAYFVFMLCQSKSKCQLIDVALYLAKCVGQNFECELPDPAMTKEETGKNALLWKIMWILGVTTWTVDRLLPSECTLDHLTVNKASYTRNKKWFEVAQFALEQADYSEVDGNFKYAKKPSYNFTPVTVLSILFALGRSSTLDRNEESNSFSADQLFEDASNTPFAALKAEAKKYVLSLIQDKIASKRTGKTPEDTFAVNFPSWCTTTTFQNVQNLGLHSADWMSVKTGIKMKDPFAYSDVLDDMPSGNEDIEIERVMPAQRDAGQGPEHLEGTSGAGPAPGGNDEGGGAGPAPGENDEGSGAGPAPGENDEGGGAGPAPGQHNGGGGEELPSEPAPRRKRGRGT